MSNELDVYARVIDGVIIEYPVYGIHIQNRAEPFEWYTKVTFAAKPVVPEYYNLTETPMYNQVTGEVIVVYGTEPKNIAQVLGELAIKGEDPMAPATAPLIGDIPQATVDRVIYLGKEYVQSRLDGFALTKGYDTIGSAVTYADSTDPVFAAEGNRARVLRDQTWRAFYTYVPKVLDGTLPFPISVAEIEAVIPSLTWE